MKALVVTEFGKIPEWTSFQDPTPSGDQVLVRVKASALSNLSKGNAMGSQYSSVGQFPFVPGLDGVGELETGERVYFLSPVKPFGAMAETALVRKGFYVSVPDNIDDARAASIANPLMSSWAALTKRAQIKKGDVVLVNGATGSAGRQAVKIARHLGASKVIATGRDAKALELVKSYGADEIISLTDAPDLGARFREAIIGSKVDIILDYLWGDTAALMLTAIGGPGAPQSSRRIQYVQIGSISGATVPLNASILRSTGLVLMGSGLGSVELPDLMQVIGDGLKAAHALDLQVEMEAVPMADAAKAWAADKGKERLVFTL